MRSFRLVLLLKRRGALLCSENMSCNAVLIRPATSGSVPGREEKTAECPGHLAEMSLVMMNE